MLKLLLLCTLLLNIVIISQSFQNSYSWSAGWTTIKPFTLDGQPHLLGYKNEDGTVAIDKINAGGEGTTEVWRGTWSAGWSSIVPFTLDGQPHLLGYKNEDGTVAIDKINAGGEGTTEVWRGTGSSNIVTRNAQMLFP